VDVAPVERVTTVERVADSLRAAMFDGRVEAGSPLREMRLAATLGVARSTVREALRVLSQEGLVTRVPHKGVVVAELMAEDVDEIYRARRLLELAGVRSCADAAPEARAALHDAVAAYEQAVRTRDQQAAVGAHLAFHAALVGLLGSRRLRAAAEGLLADVRLAMAGAARTHDDSLRQVAAHRALLTRIDAGDVDQAVAELERHLQAGEASLADEVARRSVSAAVSNREIV